MSSAPGRIRLVEASIRLDSIPSNGRDLVVHVSEEERAAVAERLKISAVERLEVKLHADKFRGGIRVTGQLEARIVQPSVVSLEPVSQDISEPIDRVFLPGSEKPYAGEAGAEIFVDLEGEDLPDLFEGPEADLSELVIETLSLAIEPYPRAEGETIEDLGVKLSDGAEESPFSKLKALKPGGEHD